MRDREARAEISNLKYDYKSLQRDFFDLSDKVSKIEKALIDTGFVFKKAESKPARWVKEK